MKVKYVSTIYLKLFQRSHLTYFDLMVSALKPQAC